MFIVQSGGRARGIPLPVIIHGDMAKKVTTYA